MAHKRGIPSTPMTCPVCDGQTFRIEFQEVFIVPQGPVRIECPACKSVWDGEIKILGGQMAGPCCTDGYEEETE